MTISVYTIPGHPDVDQQGVSPEVSVLHRRIDELEAKLRRLERTVDALVAAHRVERPRPKDRGPKG